MSDLIVVTFKDVEVAEEAREHLEKLDETKAISIDDAAIATHGSDGKISIDQFRTATGAGALGGAFWGLLIGLIFFVPLAGLAAGAIGGAIGGRFADIGIGDDFIKQVAERIEPGDSALFLLLCINDEGAFESAVADLGGHVMRSSLTADQEEALKQAWGSDT